MLRQAVSRKVVTKVHRNATAHGAVNSQTEEFALCRPASWGALQWAEGSSLCRPVSSLATHSSFSRASCFCVSRRGTCSSCASRRGLCPCPCPCLPHGPCHGRPGRSGGGDCGSGLCRATTWEDLFHSARQTKEGFLPTVNIVSAGMSFGSDPAYLDTQAGSIKIFTMPKRRM